MPKKFDNTITEARAKIIWGDSQEEVREFLVSHGYSCAESEGLIHGMLAERESEVRRAGVRKILIGGSLVVICAAILILFFPNEPPMRVRGWAKAMAIPLIAGFYGLWKFVDGVFYLLRPRTQEGSVTDMAE